MSGGFVLAGMKAAEPCPITGLAIPECCCRRCCERLLRRYEPALPDPTPDDLARRLAREPILTLEEYAKRHRISPDTARKQAREREVRI